MKISSGNNPLSFGIALRRSIARFTANRQSFVEILLGQESMV